MKTLTSDQLNQLILDSFEAERTNNTEWGMSLIHPEFRKTYMYVDGSGKLFPTITPEAVQGEVQSEYARAERFFDVVSMAADEATQTVIVEMLEGHPYTDGRPGLHSAPLVIVCQIKDGQIWRNRCYADPDVARQGLTPEEIMKVMKA